MDYVVKRLQPAAGEATNYHLVDEDGNLLLVADQTAVPRPDERRQVRLAQPDGRLLATIDLPDPPSPGITEKQPPPDYAIVHDYAVYAIVGVRRRPSVDDGTVGALYLTLEVEGEKWLILPHPEMDGCFALYDVVPSGLHTYDNLTEVDLAPSIGRLCMTDGDVAYTARLEADRLQQTDLVVLSLAFLLDRALQ